MPAPGAAQPSSPPAAEALGERLGRLLGCEIEGLRPLTGGASRATFSFEAVGPDRRHLILRLGPAGTSLGKMELEARLLRTAAVGGVPVPAVVAASDDPSALGSAYMILERVEGETIPRRILSDPELATARGQLLRQAVAALARIHRIDPESVAGLERADPLETWRGVLHGLGEAHPAFEIGLRWLEENRPPERPQCLVHGDFRLGNLMVGPDGLRAVLDWELAHVGDPLEDLGWMCVRAWRFGSDRPALGLGDYDELLGAYRAEAGEVEGADVPALEWWETFGTLRWGVMCVLMVTEGMAAGRLSVELAAIGRRACENEWDVLSCLERAGLRPAPEPAGGVPVPAAEPGPDLAASLHDRPSAAELTAAVRRWLSETVRSSESGRISFDARVAANVLAMVERELETGPEQAAAHAARLAALGVGSEAELGAAIRSGAVSWNDPLLLATVRWSVAAKLAVAHPGYGVGVASSPPEPPVRP